MVLPATGPHGDTDKEQRCLKILKTLLNSSDRRNSERVDNVGEIDKRTKGGQYTVKLLSDSDVVQTGVPSSEGK